MISSIFAFGLWYLLAAAFCSVAFLVGVGPSRRGHHELIWGEFVILAILLIVWSWIYNGRFLSFTQYFDRETFISIGYYLGIGLIYSVLEFGLEIKRSVRRFAGAWEAFISSKSLIPVGLGAREKYHTIREIITLAASDVECGYTARREIDTFLHNNGNYDDIIAVKRDSVQPVVSVNKTALANGICSWTVFWPFHLLYLIVGDLLVELWNTIANAFVFLSNKLIEVSFRNVFKL